MTTIPATPYFTDAARTNAEAKTTQDDLLDFLAEQPGGSAEQALTIASGAITPASGASRSLVVDTEASAATDELDSVTLTDVPEGALLTVRSTDAARVPTVRHGQGAAGQFLLKDNKNIVLDDPESYVTFYTRGTDVIEIGRDLSGASYANKRATISTLTAAKTLDESHDGQFFECNATSGAFTVTLPAVADVPNGFSVGFQRLNTNANKVTIDGNASEVVDLDTTYELLNAGHIAWFRSNGTKWVRTQESRAPIREVFASSGTWTRPKGVRFADVTVVGGGGGGGSGDGSQGATGGGGGGTAIERIDVSGSTTVSATRGAGGAGATVLGATGSAGATSSFGAFCSATGGTGGGLSVSGIGGIGSGGDLNIRGGYGQQYAASGIRGSNGGSSHLGGGGKGGVSSGVGQPGGAYGGGGGGGSTTASGDGGSGANGVVIAEY